MSKKMCRNYYDCTAFDPCIHKSKDEREKHFCNYQHEDKENDKYRYAKDVTEKGAIDIYRQTTENLPRGTPQKND